MKLLLSPTKTMEMTSPVRPKTSPLFLDDSREVKTALFKTLEQTSLKNFYKISDKKEIEVAKLLKDFDNAEPQAAITSFSGLVFKYLAVSSLSEEALSFLETHLLIFSGLYGLLRAFDGIKPYRLDYENPLKIENQRLEAYWSERIATYLNKEATFILNLASKEYYAPLLSKLTIPVYTFDFKVSEEGKLKTKATLAKMARGEMLRLIAENKADSLEKVKALSPQGFFYQKDLDNETTLLYVK